MIVAESAPRLRALATVRARGHVPLTRDEMWSMMLEAFTHFIQNERSNPDAVFDRDGNFVLARRSDHHYAIDPAVYEAAREGERQVDGIL